MLKKNKSDANVALQGFCTLINNQFKTHIKIIRIDNGGKFGMEDYYHKRDIIHQKTCIETPQQNAIVERKHQHIFDVARALKFQSDIQ